MTAARGAVETNRPLPRVWSQHQQCTFQPLNEELKSFTVLIQRAGRDSIVCAFDRIRCNFFSKHRAACFVNETKTVGFAVRLSLRLFFCGHCCRCIDVAQRRIEKFCHHCSINQLLNPPYGRWRPMHRNIYSAKSIRDILRIDLVLRWSTFRSGCTRRGVL